MNNDQRTSSMNSFDVHTPSESPEASSSESSTGGDWESGEFKQNELVEHWPKQQRKKLAKNSKAGNTANKTATITSPSTSSTISAKLSHQHQFKAKSNSIKIFNNTSNNLGNFSNFSNNNNNNQNHNHNNHNHHLVNCKLNVKKMRWLSNMRSDPDFRNTIVKTVNIQSPNALHARQQSSDSLDMDYYSTICDNQLSVGSPYKSPSDRASPMLRTSSSKRHQSHSHSLSQSISGKHMHANKSKQNASLNDQTQLNQQQHEQNAATGSETSELCDGHITNRSFVSNVNNGLESYNPVLIVAKPIESQSIGFNVLDTLNDTNCASGKPLVDSTSFKSQRRSVDNELLESNKFGNDNSMKSSKRPKSNDFDEIFGNNTNSNSNSNSNSIFSSMLHEQNQNQNHMTFSLSLKPPIQMSNSTSTIDKSDTSTTTNSPTDSYEGNSPPLPALPASLSVTDCDEIDGPAPNNLNDSHNKLYMKISQNSKSYAPQDSSPMTSDHLNPSSSSSSLSNATTSGQSTNDSLESSPNSQPIIIVAHRKRSRYPPFSFREIRNELRSVMRQNRNF